MEPKRLLILHGTARQGNRSGRVANFVNQYFKTRQEFITTFIEVSEFAHLFTEGLDEERKMKWVELVNGAEAILIVSPEYNHSFPGELKLLLDVTRKIFTDKIFAIAGVSDGPFGGARMADHLKVVILELGGVPLRNVTHFSKVKELFDAEGKLQDQELWEKRLGTLGDDILKKIK